MEEDDGRRGDAAREGDRERVGGSAGNRVAVEPTPEPRYRHEDCRHGGERELEARVEHGCGHPRHEHECAESEEVPAVGGPSSEPGERREPADDTRAYDGRLPADGEDVRGDRGDDRELARHTRQAQQPAEGVDPSREERNVLPGYGQEVIQAGGTEVVLNVRGQAFVLAEHDPEHDPAADSVRSARNGALDPLAKPVAEPGEPAATTELAPARRVEDDADPLAREPLPLVEAVVFGPWLDDSHRGLEDRASCRRRAADREHEQHALADRHVPEVRVAASTRVDQGDERAGAIVTSSAVPDSPSSRISTLSRRASMRSEPHAIPRSATTTASTAIRASPPSRSATTSATATAAAELASGTEIQIDSASPTQADPTSAAGQ